MKKLGFLILCGLMYFGVNAQDLDKISDMINKSQFKEARAGIDKYLANEKNSSNAMAWYLKGRIYNSLGDDKTMADSVAYSLKSEAFDALKKNQQLDPKDIQLMLEQYGSYLSLYLGFYDLGAKMFNAKNFNGAYESFKKAGEVKDYTLAKKYTYTQVKLSPLDTALVLNTAVSATQAKKTDEAITFYKKIIDANVAGPDYENVYEYVADYYSQKDDQANLNAVLNKAKQSYPKNELWAEIELRAVSKGGDKTALFAKYDQMLANDPTNFTVSYNYAIEMYNHIYGKDAAASTADLTQKNKLTEVMKRAIDNEKDGVDATVLMSNHLFNMSADLLNGSNLIKSTKPDEIKKKAELKTAANVKMDECIAYSEKAASFFASRPSLKPLQKANYKIVLGYLYDIYSIKNNPKKAAEYDAKARAVDKM